MSYSIKQAPLGARLGAGLGQGLAEQVPKEIERYRLRKGLEDFTQQSKDLDPMQRMAKLMSIPGMTAQGIQTFGELSKQQMKGEALTKLGQDKRGPERFPGTERGAPAPAPGEEPIPSITTAEGIQATRKPFIPRTSDQILKDAGEAYNANPGLYFNEPDKAIQMEFQREQQDMARSEALQKQRRGEQDIQRNIEGELAKQADKLGATADFVPGDVFTDIESKAINSVLPKEEGGQGLTERQAKVKYGKEMQDVAKDYSTINSFDNWFMNPVDGKNIRNSLEGLQKTFKKRGDLENFADTMVGRNGLSNERAYFLAYPSKEYPELQKNINSLKNLGQKLPRSFREKQTKPIVEKLANNLGKGSPLSVGVELKKKGYEPDIWYDYLNKNSGNLDLTERQVRELNKKRSDIPALNDLWLFSLGEL